MVDISTKMITYEFPNTGCLLGSAYQAQMAALADALKSASLDITPAEYIILRALYSGGTMQQCEIVRLLGKDKGAVCRTVANMAKKGIVVADAVSYKCVNVSLSDAGNQLRDKIDAIARDRHAALENIIGKEDLETLQRILKTIVKHSK